MSSFARMMKILDLFGPERSTIDVESIGSLLNYPQATAYRYVRGLCEVGLLVRLSRGYAIGPRVIELDRTMRDYDPILSGSRELLASLVERTGLGVLLSELYGDRVINVHEEPGRDAQQLRYGRGRPFSLFRSATSLAILAYLQPRHLKRIYEGNRLDPDVGRIGTDWKSFGKALLRIRQDGYCLTSGELSPGRKGIAAPIFDEQMRVLGSLTLIGDVERFESYNESFLAKLICDCADDFSSRVMGKPSVGERRADDEEHAASSSPKDEGKHRTGRSGSPRRP